MTDLRKAAEDLLEGVEAAIKAGDWKVDGACDPDSAIVRLRQALAQPEQEPIGYIDGMHGGYMVFTPLNPAAVYLNGTALYTAPPKQGYQYEVVAEHANGTYTTKRIPKREWVGLTDEEKSELVHKYKHIETGWLHDADLIAETEAKLKEKNT